MSDIPRSRFQIEGYDGVMYFYSFVVDHGVDGYGGGFIVGGVGLLAKLCAPRRGEDGEGGVGGHG